MNFKFRACARYGNKFQIIMCLGSILHYGSRRVAASGRSIFGFRSFPHQISHGIESAVNVVGSTDAGVVHQRVKQRHSFVRFESVCVLSDQYIHAVRWRHGSACQQWRVFCFNNDPLQIQRDFYFHSWREGITVALAILKDDLLSFTDVTNRGLPRPRPPSTSRAGKD